jgi:hypothetical protein
MASKIVAGPFDIRSSSSFRYSTFVLRHFFVRIDSFARFCLHQGREMDGPACTRDSAMFLHHLGNSAGPLQS